MLRDGHVRRAGRAAGQAMAARRRERTAGEEAVVSNPPGVPVGLPSSSRLARLSPCRVHRAFAHAEISTSPPSAPDVILYGPTTTRAAVTVLVRTLMAVCGHALGGAGEAECRSFVPFGVQLDAHGSAARCGRRRWSHRSRRWRRRGSSGTGGRTARPACGRRVSPRWATGLPRLEALAPSAHGRGHGVSSVSWLRCPFHLGASRQTERPTASADSEQGGPHPWSRHFPTQARPSRPSSGQRAKTARSSRSSSSSPAALQVATTTRAALSASASARGAMAPAQS